VSGYTDPSFLDLGFTARERAPGTHWIGGWVGPRAGRDAMEYRKIFALTGNQTLNFGKVIGSTKEIFIKYIFI
jgi:hypothetical protein